MPLGRTLWNQRVRLSDGAELAADVVLPAAEGRFPTVITRTPYMRQRNLHERSWLKLVDYGYAYVAVDMRGRGDSTGTFTPFVADGPDGYKVVEWAAAQEWSTGKVGMVGGSYEGVTQWWTAKARPPHLACIVPQAVGAARSGPRWSADTGIPVQYWAWWMNLVRGRTFQNPGGPSWESSWEHLPLRSLDRRLGITRSAWSAYVQGELDYLNDDYALSKEDFAELDLPVLVGVGWWDDQQTMTTWEALQASRGAAKARLLIGAWDHAGNILPRPELGGLDVTASIIEPIPYIERFLSLHLKGVDDGIASAPPCHVFRTGANRWEDLDAWPDPGARERAWYLRSGGAARSLRGDGRLASGAPAHVEPPDTFVYDPLDPGRDLVNLDVMAWSDPPLDRRYAQRRDDTLVYSSEPLLESLDVSGQAIFEAHVSTSGRDTDFFLEVCDVHPDGRAIGLGTDGSVRLRYHDGAQETFVPPGEVASLRIPGPYMHHTFLPGHRIRLTVRSSNFPNMARNLNTGGHWADEVEPQVVTNSVHHTSAHPSRLLLPVQGEPA